MKTGSDECKTILKTPRSCGSKQESLRNPKAEQAGDAVVEKTALKPPQQSAAESFSFAAIDSRALHSGIKQQGSAKMGTQVASRVVDVVASSAATPKLSSNEAAKGWPFEQPARPRDFKSREDR